MAQVNFKPLGAAAGSIADLAAASRSQTATAGVVAQEQSLTKAQFWMNVGFFDVKEDQPFVTYGKKGRNGYKDSMHGIPVNADDLFEETGSNRYKAIIRRQNELNELTREALEALEPGETRQYPIEGFMPGMVLQVRRLAPEGDLPEEDQLPSLRERMKAIAAESKAAAA